MGVVWLLMSNGELLQIQEQAELVPLVPLVPMCQAPKK